MHDYGKGFQYYGTRGHFSVLLSYLSLFTGFCPGVEETCQSFNGLGKRLGMSNGLHRCRAWTYVCLAYTAQQAHTKVHSKRPSGQGRGGDDTVFQKGVTNKNERLALTLRMSQASPLPSGEMGTQTNPFNNMLSSDKQGFTSSSSKQQSLKLQPWISFISSGRRSYNWENANNQGKMWQVGTHGDTDTT